MAGFVTCLVRGVISILTCVTRLIGLLQVRRWGGGLLA